MIDEDLTHTHISVPVELRVTTESSLWVIHPDRYMRLPLSESPRRPVYSIEDRLRDGKWHEMRDIWFRWEDDGVRLRILPAVGPEDGYGIISGIIKEVAGDYELAEDEDPFPLS